MLTELRINNFAIIQELELHFETGLTTFTGETGAGKSIILDAIMAILGERIDISTIRSGADQAWVEGVFRLSDENRAAIQQILETESLFDEDSSDYVTLARELRIQGRSVARVNGRSVNVSLLRDIGAHLIDIHGQSEHLSLLNEKQHIHLLDRYAGCEAEIKEYQAIYQKVVKLQRELNELQQNEQEAARQMDFLTFQIQEIETANLVEGEDEDLKLERDRLANAEKIAELAQQSLLILNEGSPESPPVSDLLGEVIRSLNTLSRIDKSLEKLAGQAENAVETLSDISLELQDYIEQIEYNPRRLVRVEERLDMIQNLKRKYGKDISSVLAFAQTAREKLQKITNSEERIAEIRLEIEEKMKDLSNSGQKVSDLRMQEALTLAKGVEKELADLSMLQARFMVDIQQSEDKNGVQLADGRKVHFDASGLDRVAFLIAPNPGEGFKPLVKTASGGETARLMLALKNVLARVDVIPTLIFDEIDQGIGGRIGAVVGEKLWKLSLEHQVLCVTHLPQLAAFGKQHFRVSKQILDGRTITHVQKLEEGTRLVELAEMLGSPGNAGKNAAQETLNHARQRADILLKQA